MGSRKLPYKEGDWIAIPLQKLCFVAGRLARVPAGGRVVLGYFFRAIYPVAPTLDDLSNQPPEDAILVAKFGDLGIIEGKWKILGSEGSWIKSEWPVPLMYRQDSISGSWWVTKYSEELTPLREWKIEGSPPPGYCSDSMRGYVALERELVKLLV